VPFSLKGIVDHFGSEARAELLVPMALVAAYGGLRLATSLFNELRDILFSRVRYKAMHKLSVDVLEHLHRQNLRFHLERNTGAISRDLERGTASLSELLNYMVFSIAPIALELSMVVGILVFNYPLQYTLVTLLAVGLYIAFTIRFMDWRSQYRVQMNKLDSEANGRAVDSLINYETVKYFNNEKRESAAYDTLLTQWADAAQKSVFSMSVLNLCQSALVAIGVTVMMALAAVDVADETLSLGDLVMLNALLLQLFIPLNFLGVIYRSMRYSLINMDRIVELLKREPEVVDSEEARELQITAGAIEFDRVDFSYGEQRSILRGLSFKVEAGQKVAIVGPSGAGKSTLARLLLRFYDIQSGCIRIDGQDISQVRQDSLRRAVAVVPQDAVLFNDTLRYNLEYAKPGACEAEILAALEAAELGAFLASLPEGLDTVVGERGLKLSGGEKQRVAIARAVLKQAPLVIFDEATSSLDSRAERQITGAMQRLSQKTTALVIAHRLSTIEDADVILVLEKGKLVEQGDHQQLLEAQGLYHQLWSLQHQRREVS
ncbi:MAG: ABCB family ABC transporter ATP-binding protein/permease, partial [Granulosicoccaceae bacterium]